MARSIAKITRPTLRAMAPRPRLFGRVDRLVRDHPLVWVSAPAGSGKTTLAATWIAARRRPCLWYHLDARDADAATFFYYQREAVRRLAPRRRETLPLLTAEYALGPAAYARTFFERVGARVPPGTTIVLDDFQELPDDAPLQALLAAALRALPERVRVLVLSRSAPPPPFSRLIVEGLVGFLVADELNLSAAETRALAEARTGERIAASAASALRARTGGWAAGTVLLLEAPGRALPPRRGAASAAQQVLFEFFASEIFDRAPAGAQRLLLATALVPEVSVPAARALAREPRAADILSDLVRRNYFTVRLAGNEPRYRYHPLFRDFLLSAGRRLLSAERLAEIRREGARLLEQAGEPETAVELFREAGSLADVARVALRHAPEMLSTGRAGALSSWLESLPREILEGEPWLLHWLGLAIAPVRPAEGHRHLERCFELLGAGADAATLYSLWASSASTYLYRWDTGNALTGWVSRWDELRRRHPRFPDPEIEEQVAPVIFAALVFTAPLHPELPHWERRCVELVRAGRGTRRSAAAAAFALFCHLYFSGRHGRAGDVVETLAPTSFDGRDPVAAIAWGTAVTMLRWLVEGRRQPMLERCEAVLERARQNGLPLWNFFLNYQCACFAPDPEIARRFVSGAHLALDPTDRLQGAHQHQAEATLALRRGDASGAAEHAERAILLASQDAARPFLFAELLGRVTLVLALLEKGELDAASERLRDLCRTAERDGGRFAELLRLLAEAALRQKRGEERDAVSALAEAMPIGAAHSIFVVPCFTDEQMATLCALSLAHGVEVDYVGQLIARRELSPPREAELEEHWPRAVKVFTLGRFELWRDGRRVSFHRKVQRRPLELLRALVTLGGEDVRVESLVDALWPDADGDAAAHALETTLYRLRKLLGASGAVVRHDQRISLDPRLCWVDAFALERRLGRALAMVEQEQPDAEHVAREADHILDLYRGPLVPVVEDGRDCAEAMRGRLRFQLSRFVRMAARHLVRAGVPERAARCLARAGEADPGLTASVHSALVA